MTTTKILLSANLPNTRLVGEDGKLSFPWLKYFQALQIAGSSFDLQGSLQAPISPLAPIAVRGIPIGTLLQHITDLGLLDSTNSIAVDGTGHPLTGGKAAYTALVTSGPTAGQVLEWNGSGWLPATLAAGVSSLNALTGALAITAGSGVTVTPSGSNIQISAAGGGAGYVKGAVNTGPIAGAGTFTASGTVTGATTGSVVSVGVVNSTEGALLSNLLGWVTSLNNVTIQYTASGASLALNLPVVVFN